MSDETIKRRSILAESGSIVHSGTITAAINCGDALEKVPSLRHALAGQTAGVRSAILKCRLPDALAQCRVSRILCN